MLQFSYSLSLYPDWHTFVMTEAEEVLLFVVSVSFQLPQRRGASHPAQAPDGRVCIRHLKAGRCQRRRNARLLHEHVGQEEVRSAHATQLSPSASE